MNLQQFLQQFALTKKSKQKSNVTSIKGGKWYIPKDKLSEFYDIVFPRKDRYSRRKDE